MTPLERFKPKYRVDGSGCWIWTAAKYPNGYGAFLLRGFVTTAHRCSWMIFMGSIPDGMDVCHTCDVRACVNPEHLWLGTPTENMADCMKKNRYYSPNRVKAGEANGMARLAVEDVLYIRESKERQIDLAARYGVKQGHISAIKLRKTWAHIA
jgi:hypothetical protein